MASKRVQTFSRVSTVTTTAVPSVCLGCGELFAARRRDMAYCAARCRARAWRARRVERLLSHFPLMKHYMLPAVADELLGPLADAIRGADDPGRAE